MLFRSGVSIDVLPEIYEAGFPVMAADHASAACECSISSWDGDGAQVLRSFVIDTCGAQANWNMKNFISDQIELIREQVGDRKVLLALSGGVDSSVVAALLDVYKRQCQDRSYFGHAFFVRVRHEMGRDGGNRCPFQSSGYPLWDNCPEIYDTRFNIWCSERLTNVFFKIRRKSYEKKVVFYGNGIDAGIVNDSLFCRQGDTGFVCACGYPGIRD